jgi:hypothetical protein
MKGGFWKMIAASLLASDSTTLPAQTNTNKRQTHSNDIIQVCLVETDETN